MNHFINKGTSQGEELSGEGNTTHHTKDSVDIFSASFDEISALIEKNLDELILPKVLHRNKINNFPDINISSNFKVNQLEKEIEEFFERFSNYRLRRFHNTKGIPLSGNVKEYTEFAHILEKSGVKLEYFSPNIIPLIKSLMKVLSTKTGQVYFGQFSTFFGISSGLESKTYDPHIIHIPDAPVLVPYQYNSHIYGYEAMIEFKQGDDDFKKNILNILGIHQIPEALLEEKKYLNRTPICENMISEITSRKDVLTSLDLCVYHFEETIKGFDSSFVHPDSEFNSAFSYYESFRNNYMRSLEYYVQGLYSALSDSEKKEIDDLNKMSLYAFGLDNTQFDVIFPQISNMFRKFLFFHVYKNINISDGDTAVIFKDPISFRHFLSTLKLQFDDFEIFDDFISRLSIIKNNDNLDYQRTQLTELIENLEYFSDGIITHNNTLYHSLSKKQRKLFENIYIKQYPLNNGTTISIFRILQRILINLKESLAGDLIIKDKIGNAIKYFDKIKDFLKIILPQVSLKFIDDIEKDFTHDEVYLYNFLKELTERKKIDFYGKKNLFHTIGLSPDLVEKFILYSYIEYLKNKGFSISKFMSFKKELEEKFLLYTNEFINSFPDFNKLPEMDTFRDFFTKYNAVPITQDEKNNIKKQIKNVSISLEKIQNQTQKIYDHELSKYGGEKDIKNIIDNERKNQKGIYKYFETDYTKSDGIVYCEEYRNGKLYTSYLIRYPA